MEKIDKSAVSWGGNEMGIELIFENDDLMVLNKPPFWVTTKEGRLAEGGLSVEGWLSKRQGQKVKRQGIVHRLDKGTSGLLLVAKNEVVLELLKKQFKERRVEKKYLAMAGGDLPDKGEIDMPIGRSPYSFARFAVVWNGKSSRTLFRVMAKYRIEGKIYSLVDIDLKTGRTHQIRVHFKYLGWPLLGDKAYGGQMGGEIKRPFLHAYYLSFINPGNGQRLVFESPLAADLQVILNQNEKVG